MSDEGGGASRSTDPAAGSSAATDVSLREYVEMRIVAESRRLETLIGKEHELRLARREDDREALRVATDSLGTRLDAMNEFRDQLKDQAATFIRRDAVEEMLKAVHTEIDRQGSFQAKLAGALVLAGVVVPIITGVVVYVLTRHGVPVDAVPHVVTITTGGTP